MHPPCVFRRMANHGELTRGTIFTGVEGAGTSSPLLPLPSAGASSTRAPSGGGREGLANGDTRPSSSDCAAVHRMTQPSSDLKRRSTAITTVSTDRPQCGRIKKAKLQLVLLEVRKQCTSA